MFVYGDLDPQISTNTNFRDVINVESCSSRGKAGQGPVQMVKKSFSKLKCHGSKIQYGLEEHNKMVQWGKRDLRSNCVLK